MRGERSKTRRRNSLRASPRRVAPSPDDGQQSRESKKQNIIDQADEVQQELDRLHVNDVSELTAYVAQLERQIKSLQEDNEQV